MSSLRSSIEYSQGIGSAHILRDKFASQVKQYLVRMAKSISCSLRHRPNLTGLSFKFHHNRSVSVMLIDLHFTVTKML